MMENPDLTNKKPSNKSQPLSNEIEVNKEGESNESVNLLFGDIKKLLEGKTERDLLEETEKRTNPKKEETVSLSSKEIIAKLRSKAENPSTARIFNAALPDKKKEKDLTVKDSIAVLYEDLQKILKRSKDKNKNSGEIQKNKSDLKLSVSILFKDIQQIIAKLKEKRAIEKLSFSHSVSLAFKDVEQLIEEVKQSKKAKKNQLSIKIYTGEIEEEPSVAKAKKEKSDLAKQKVEIFLKKSANAKNTTLLEIEKQSSPDDLSLRDTISVLFTDIQQIATKLKKQKNAIETPTLNSSEVLKREVNSNKSKNTISIFFENIQQVFQKSKENKKEVSIPAGNNTISVLFNDIQQFFKETKENKKVDKDKIFSQSYNSFQEQEKIEKLTLQHTISILLDDIQQIFKKATDRRGRSIAKKPSKPIKIFGEGFEKDIRQPLSREELGTLTTIEDLKKTASTPKTSINLKPFKSYQEKQYLSQKRQNHFEQEKRSLRFAIILLFSLSLGIITGFKNLFYDVSKNSSKHSKTSISKSFKLDESHIEKWLNIFQGLLDYLEETKPSKKRSSPIRLSEFVEMIKKEKLYLEEVQKICLEEELEVSLFFLISHSIGQVQTYLQAKEQADKDLAVFNKILESEEKKYNQLKQSFSLKRNESVSKEMGHLENILEELELKISEKEEWIELQFSKETLSAKLFHNVQVVKAFQSEFITLWKEFQHRIPKKNSSKEIK